MSNTFLTLSPKEIQFLLENWNLPSPESSGSSKTPNKPTFSPKPCTEWNPYNFEQIQIYNPLYSKILPTDANTQAIENSIILNSHYCFHDLYSVRTKSEEHGMQQKKPMFIKFSPLLDPLRYLTGKYGGFTNTDNPELKQLPTPENYRLFSTTPSPSNTKEPPLQKGIRKLNDPNNASYVDGFFYYLSSRLLNTYNLENGVDFYGSFLAIQKQFRMNVYDDITYLRRYSYFNDNREKGYHIYDQTFLNYLEFEKSKKHKERNSRNHNKVRLELSTATLQQPMDGVDVMELLGIEDLSTPALPQEQQDINPLPPSSNEDLPEILDMNAPIFSSPPVVSISNTMDENDKSSSDEDEDEDEDEDDLSNEDSDSDDSDDDEDSVCPPVDDEENETLYVYMEDFPVQMICMETCHGTLDQLFLHKSLNPSNYDTEGASMMFQVVATLIAYQKAYNFTHNDLHTNNIMWVSTPIQYIYYQIEGQVYKVPTYNRIYKIIDFGRAIYNYQGQRFCSDSFASPEGDASTQYNCLPYLMPSKPVVEPNPSFDLCRLACAIYDFLVDDHEIFEEADEDEDNNDNEGDDKDEEESVWESEPDDTLEIPETLFAKLIIEWCEDDKGKNMLYKKSGKERYPYFKLYQMIARTVHRHVPLKQIHNPLFQPFLLPSSFNLEKKKKSDVWINIDDISDYTK